MSHIIANHIQLPHALESLLQDLLVGTNSYWQQKFQPVMEELMFRTTNRMAWEVQQILNTLPKNILKSMLKHTHSVDDVEYRLNWGPEGNGPYNVSVWQGRIQSDGEHSPHHFDQQALNMIARYGDYDATEYTYVLEHHDLDTFIDFIDSEIDRHQSFQTAVANM